MIAAGATVICSFGSGVIGVGTGESVAVRERISVNVVLDVKIELSE